MFCQRDIHENFAVFDAALTLPAHERIIYYPALVQTHIVYSTVNVAPWDSLTFPINPHFIFPRIFIDKVFRKPQKFDNQDTHMQQITVFPGHPRCKQLGMQVLHIASSQVSWIQERWGGVAWCLTPPQRSWCCISWCNGHDVAIMMLHKDHDVAWSLFYSNCYIQRVLYSE